MKLSDNNIPCSIGPFLLRALYLAVLFLPLDTTARAPMYDVRINVAPSLDLKNHTEALHHARLESWAELLKRLTPIEHHERLNNIPEAVISTIIDSFSVEGEQNTSQGYQGAYLFHYSEKAVKNLLNAHEIPFIETSFPHTLVIPVLQTDHGFALWDEENTLLPTWRNMVNSLNYFNFKVPLGDITDYETFSPQDLLDGNKEALQAMMRRYNTNDIAIFIIAPTEDHLTISIWPYMMSHGFEPTHLTRNNTPEEYASLGNTCFTHLIERWKMLKKTNSNDETYATQITLSITGLDDLKNKTHMLRKMNKLQSSSIKRLKANRVTFSVLYDGSRQHLEEKLKSLDINPILPTSGAPLHVA